MTIQEAKKVLMLYRPGRGDEAGPEVVEALKMAQQDPELGRWYASERAFHNSIRQKLREIQPPRELKAAILAQRTVIRPARWRMPASWSAIAWAAAAVIFILAVLGGFWLKPRVSNEFANFRARMIGAALREYRMDIVTNDMREVRQYLASQGAPADYILPAGLQNLQLTGGGFLTWRNNPVSMVCFNGGKGQMLFLFVTPKSAVKDPPPPKGEPLVFKTRELMTASWSDGGRVYLLAGPENTEFHRYY